jgi:hypothetical protein
MNLKNRFLYGILNYWKKQTTEKGSLWFKEVVQRLFFNNS